MKRPLCLTLLTGCLLTTASAHALGGEGQAAYSGKSPSTPASPEKLVALFDKLLVVQEACAVDGGSDTVGLVIEKLAKELAVHSESRDVVFPLLERHFTASDSTDLQRSRILDLVAWVPGKEALQAAQRFLTTSPRSFGENHLLAFAEQGSEPHAVALRERIDAGHAESIRPVAFFALHGDASGKQELLKAAQMWKQGHSSLADGYVAAWALAELGDRALLDSMPALVHEKVLAALDEGDLERARKLALGREYFAAMESEKAQAWSRKSKVGFGLSYLPHRLEYHASARAEEAQSAAQIFDLIERLTPASS